MLKPMKETPTRQKEVSNTFKLRINISIVQFAHRHSLGYQAKLLAPLLTTEAIYTCKHVGL